MSPVWRVVRVLMLSAALGGCFSADDFSQCIEPGQCGVDGDGRALVCVSGACRLPPPVDETSAVILSGELGNLHSHPDRVVIIDEVVVSEASFRVEADVIIVRGPIRGTGVGLSGGRGGASGVVGSPGEGGAQGQPARDAVAAGGVGGEGGVVDGDGAAGASGLYPVDEPCRIDFDFAQPGSGGGGGGGGGGGTGDGACRGSRGGAGGAGGAAIMLRAERRLEVRGALLAAGVAGQDAEAAVCANAGVGAPGGGGSGGLVYLHAPSILFGAQAVLDVSGGDAAGGLVTIFGEVDGRFPLIEGASGRQICSR